MVPYSKSSYPAISNVSMLLCSSLISESYFWHEKIKNSEIVDGIKIIKSMLKSWDILSGGEKDLGITIWTIISYVKISYVLQLFSGKVS